MMAHVVTKRPFEQVDGIARTSPVNQSPTRGVDERNHKAHSRLSKLRQEQPRRLQFDPDASIVLIGVRGVGKSSLALLAATAYSRRVVDSERAFLDATSSSAQVYRKIHGFSEYHWKQAQVLKHTFEAHQKNCIIVCSFSDLERDGLNIVRSFAQDHPVVHVTRDAKGIQSHLKVWSEERVNELMVASGPILRSCTNYEFFNLTDSLTGTQNGESAISELPDVKGSKGCYLTLKNVERDFLKLLRNVIGDQGRMPSHHSAYPLSQIPVHERRLTLCAGASVDHILDPNVNLEGLQIGADAVELHIHAQSLDIARPYERISTAFAKLRRATILPIILTVHKKRGISSAGQLSVTDLLDCCLRTAAEYCTIDLALKQSDLMALTGSRGRTKLIGHWHESTTPAHSWHDPHCSSVYERAEQLGCDVVKITMPARSLEDNFSTRIFQRKVKAMNGAATLVAYNTGKCGRMSKCFGTPLIPVSPHDRKADEFGEDDDSVTAKEVIHALFANFVFNPLQFFIYGANVDYSLSPAMHNAAYTACGMSHNYGTHSSSTLEDFQILTREHDFGGAAVVQPYKVDVIPLLDGLSPHARAIGSVNTIVPVRELIDGAIPDELTLLSQRNQAGPVTALYGYNTDWIGIRACLRRGLSPANTVRPQSSALVCGAGGQARSTVYALLSLGVRNIFVCNRTVENARRLADHYNDLIATNAISELSVDAAAHTRVLVLETFDSSWPAQHRLPTLIVSCVPTQSMDGSPIEFSIPSDWLRSPTGGVLIELAYRPMNTPIVQQMRDPANKAWIFMNGFDILPEQAFAQFELFTGRRAPRKLMRDEVMKAHRAQQDRLSSEPRNLDPNPVRT